MRTWLMAAALLTTGFVALATDDAKKSWTFEDDTPGAAPKGFSPAVGEWTVVTTDGGKVLAQSARNANTAFNVVLVDDTKAKDVDISVKVKAIAGELDQGGGLVWRARDAKNYYIVRFNLHFAKKYSCKIGLFSGVSGFGSSAQGRLWSP